MYVSLVGAHEGCDDGSLEGGNVGLEDGCDDGSLEGGNVGLEDGDKVGSLEGDNVGRREGSPEGFSDDDDDDDDVGQDDRTIQGIIDGDVESRGDAVGSTSLPAFGSTSLPAFVEVDDRIGVAFKSITREREHSMTITTDSAASALGHLFSRSPRKTITDFFLWRYAGQ
jgi:hypothetical protein